MIRHGTANEQANRVRQLLPSKKNGRYVFVTVRILAEKYATRLYEYLAKTDKTACPGVVREPDRLLFSQRSRGDGKFF